MKYTFLTALFALFSFSIVNAQQFSAKATLTLIDQSEVPDAVLQAQDHYFPLQSVRQWKKQEYNGSRSDRTQYLAVFNTDGQNIRARYTSVGQGISTYTNYRPSDLPSPIQETISSDYADYTLTGAARIASLQGDWAGFHIRLRRNAQKLTLWLSEDGQLINPREIPQEVDSEMTE